MSSTILTTIESTFPGLTTHQIKLASLPIFMFLVIGLNGCSSLPTIQYSADKVLHGSLNGHSIEHVVVFAIDGLEQETLVKYLMQSPPRRPGGLHDLLGVRVDPNGLLLEWKARHFA